MTKRFPTGHHPTTGLYFHDGRRVRGTTFDSMVMTVQPVRTWDLDGNLDLYDEEFVLRFMDTERIELDFGDLVVLRAIEDGFDRMRVTSDTRRKWSIDLFLGISHDLSLHGYGIHHYDELDGG